jgi:hypothetical protein
MGTKKESGDCRFFSFIHCLCMANWHVIYLNDCHIVEKIVMKHVRKKSCQ